jgi:hypothetical protein
MGLLKQDKDASRALAGDIYSKLAGLLRWVVGTSSNKAFSIHTQEGVPYTQYASTCMGTIGHLRGGSGEKGHMHVDLQTSVHASRVSGSTL